MIRHLRHIPQFTVNAVNFAIRATRFFAIVIVFYIIYKLLLEQTLDGSKQILPILALWVISSYLVIPKIHRILTNYYLPNYFVGRIRSPSGLLSDPVNLAFFGSASDLHQAMHQAGWSKAEKLTFKTLIRVVYCSALRKSYKNAPVGDMYLFNRVQDFAYQQQINGSPNERHHVRFWKTPHEWRLPGGHKADWIAAATYDTHVGIKIATGQLDHFIHVDTDVERDYMIESLQKAKVVKKIDIAEHFTNAYHDRSNGGDRIKTDGSLPFIYL